ncbi:MAG: threonine aldolase [Saprospiraceae bacterium]|nr:threonine aldolase [Saprospiraceae bacterium]
MLVNFKSDTVTKPSQAMLSYMLSAPVGDDVFGEDPTVNALQDKTAIMFGHEDALFCPSGTMTNQIAVQLHTTPLAEIICEEDAHIYQYETGGYAYNARCAINLVKGRFGKMQAGQVQAAIKQEYDWLPLTKMVSIENSCNRGGGTYYSIDEAAEIRNVCRDNQLAFHLDGARLFNVLVETGDKPEIWGALFDTISICLSKGLGAPVGSLLIGSKSQIARARRFRKVMGGGMRQAGILAAAGIFALDHHIDRLKVDNNRAKMIGAELINKGFVKNVRPVMTNIVICDLVEEYPVQKFIADLDAKNIQVVQMGPQAVRFVTHLDLNDAMIDYALAEIRKM